MNRIRFIVGPVMAILVVLASGQAQVFADSADKSGFEVYGFAQADVIQDVDRVDPQWTATLRPSKIPTTQGEFGSNGESIVSARQSRLGAKATLPTDNGDVFSEVEFDFFGVGVDAGQTTIRLRQAYGEWKSLLGGQTESLFMDKDLFPNIIDYWGPCGMVFLRNPQVRWTPISGKNSVAIAVEHPSNDIDPGTVREFDPDLGNNITGNEKIPDFTIQLRHEEGWGHFQLASILRRISFDTLDTPGNRPSGSTFGWGVDLSSNLNFGKKDKLHSSIVYGHGIATYMNDGGVDAAATTSSSGAEIEAVPLIGYMVYYDHYWFEKLATSLGYSRTQVDNTDLQLSSAFHNGQYASINLIYYPTKNMFLGGEFLWGERRDTGGPVGIDRRFQFSTNYKFTSADFFGRKS